MIEKKEKIVLEFIEAFEEVFSRDWQYTKEMLGIYDETESQIKVQQDIGLESIPIISKSGTFIDPKVDDETEDWGNRGDLLKKYRELLKIFKDEKKST